jgi:hypothetical protein
VFDAVHPERNVLGLASPPIGQRVIGRRAIRTPLQQSRHVRDTLDASETHLSSGRLISKEPACVTHDAPRGFRLVDKIEASVTWSHRLEFGRTVSSGPSGTRDARPAPLRRNGEANTSCRPPLPPRTPRRTKEIIRPRTKNATRTATGTWHTMSLM